MKTVSGKRMCRILEQHRWSLARINGSHHIYRDATATRRTVVPVHGNQVPKPSTQRAIMRDTDLNDGEL
jgi:predicted RNA binding protein YcfA (HicA-like mRNA interferase family)